MRGICRAGLTLALVLMVAGPALAQRQRGGFGFGGGGYSMLLGNEGVQKELKLDEEQMGKVKDLVQKNREKSREAFGKLRDLPREEQAKKRQELTRTINEETLKAAGDILKPEQLKRLKQIELQQARTQAYARPEVQKALSMTDEQKEKIKAINEDAGKQMRELFQGGNVEGAREKMQAIGKETASKIQGVLTDEQKKTFKEMTGEPFEVRFQPRRPNNNQ